MKPSDGYHGDMSGYERLTDAEIEALLTGDTPEGLESIGGLIAEIRSLEDDGVDEAVAQRHITAAAELARSTTTTGVTGASRSAAPAGTRTRRRKRTVFAGITSTIAGKILTGAVAAVAATGTAAAAGVLPEPIQDVVDDKVIVVEEIQEMKRVREQARIQLEDPAGDPAEVQTQQRDQQQTNQGSEDQPGDGTQNQYGQTDDQPGQQGDDPAQHHNGDGNDGTQNQYGQTENGAGGDEAGRGQGGSEQDRSRGNS